MNLINFAMIDVANISFVFILNLLKLINIWDDYVRFCGRSGVGVWYTDGTLKEELRDSWSATPFLVFSANIVTGTLYAYRIRIYIIYGQMTIIEISIFSILFFHVLTFCMKKYEYSRMKQRKSTE